MTFAAGYHKSVPAPIAPRGQGYGRYGTGYQNVFNCRSANNVFHVESLAALAEHNQRVSPFRFSSFSLLLFSPPLFFYST